MTFWLCGYTTNGSRQLCLNFLELVLGCWTVLLYIPGCSWQCLKYFESKKGEDSKGRFIFFEGLLACFPLALWNIFIFCLGEEQPFHSYPRDGGWYRKWCPVYFLRNLMSQSARTCTFLPKALRKTLSLSLLASGDSRHSLSCGCITASFTWPSLYLFLFLLSQISVCLSLTRTVVTVVRAHPNNPGCSASSQDL